MKNELHKKFVDGVRAPHTGAQWKAHVRAWIIAHAHRTPVLVVLALVLILANSVIYLAAFEAHVVNVTATIERPPTMCNALSIGYWRNHEGCTGGEGESDWTSEIHVMTSNFSGIFYNITGAEICEALWVPNCPSGNNILSKRCKATAMALADELNLVSSRLDLDALIAGADDGSAAFDHLWLTYNSTVRDALVQIEMILGNPNSTTGQLTDAAYVAERIYAFYEDENPNAPQCVMDPIILPLNISSFSASSPSSGEENSSDEDEEDNDGNNKDNKNDKDEDSNETSEEQSIASTEETATSTDEEITSSTEETATSGDEVITNTEENSEGSVEQIVTPEESTEPTATSSEEEIIP